MVFQLVFEKRAMWMWCALVFTLLLGMGTAHAAEKSASVRESQTEGNGVASRRLQASQHPDSSADRSLGVSVNQIGPDVSWGASADIPFSMGAAQCDFDATVQGGDRILGKSALEVEVPVAGFDAGIFTKMNVKGYSVSDLGRSTDIGAKFGRTFSFGRASDGGGSPPDGNGSATALQNPRPKAGDIQVSLGIFGRNGGVFSQPTALKTLEDNGYDITALGDLGLDAVNPAPTGLSLKAGNSVNALIEAEFDLDFAHVRVQAMPELSASEDAVHQLITTLQSSWELGTHLQLTGTLDVGFQTFEGSLEREIANLWVLSLDF